MMENEMRLIDANDVYSLFDQSGRAGLHVPILRRKDGRRD